MILPEHADPGDFTGIPSLTCDDTSPPTWSWVTVRQHRPEITEDGFYVKESGLNSLNDTGVVYNYIATA